MTIQGLWTARRVPIVSGIYFASGELHTLLASPGSAGHTTITHGDVQSIDELCRDEGVSYASLDPLFETEISLHARRIQALCGEGSYGGDGFVCATECDAVLWIAFFTYSNPFIYVEQLGGCLIARNSCDERWSFPIDSPQNVSVAVGAVPR
jgi:hypothetical protein